MSRGYNRQSGFSAREARAVKQYVATEEARVAKEYGNLLRNMGYEGGEQVPNAREFLAKKQQIDEQLATAQKELSEATAADEKAALKNAVNELSNVKDTIDDHYTDKTGAEILGSVGIKVDADGRIEDGGIPEMNAEQIGKLVDLLPRTVSTDDGLFEAKQFPSGSVEMSISDDRQEELGGISIGYLDRYKPFTEREPTVTAHGYTKDGMHFVVSNEVKRSAERISDERTSSGYAKKTRTTLYVIDKENNRKAIAKWTVISED